MIRASSASEPLSWRTAAELAEVTHARLRRGLAPPREAYDVQYRQHIDWSQAPEWARPVDPEVFDGCCHEG